MGGWIKLYGTKKADSDNDGIPDEWEIANGLDINNSKDSIQLSSNGYTYIEEYANSLVSIPVCQVNKVSLRQAITDGEKVDRTYRDYIDFTKLDDVMQQGVDLLSAYSVTQEQIDNMTVLVNNCIADVNNNYLWKLIDVILEVRKLDKEIYTQDSYNKLEDAIKAGELLMSSDYTESQIDLAVEEINSAKNGLVISIKEDFEKCINKYKYVINVGYYGNSWANFKLALDNAEKAYNEFQFNENDYQKYMDELINAYNNLSGPFEKLTRLENQGLSRLNSARRYYYGDLDKMNYDSSFVISTDVMYTSVYQCAPIAFYLKNPETEKTYDYVLYIMPGGSVSLHIGGKYYISNYKISANTQYNVACYVNKEENKVYFYVNGELIRYGFDIPFDTSVLYEDKIGMSMFYYGNYNTYNFYVSNVKAEEIIFDKSISKLGDADYNGELNAADASCVLQKVLNNSYSMPIEESYSDYLKYVDVNCDGRLSADDSAIILQKVLKNDYIMPIEATTETTTETTTQTTTVPIESTTGVLTETTTENTTVETTYVLSYSIDFENIGGYKSPYTDNLITVESINDTIDLYDVDIFDCKSAIKGADNIIKLNIPHIMKIQLDVKNIGNSVSALIFEKDDGYPNEIICMPDAECSQYIINEGEISVTSQDYGDNILYIAGIKLYDIVS